MTFPIVAATNQGQTVSLGTSYTVNLPSGIAAGDLLRILIGAGTNGAFQAVTGWTILWQKHGTTVDVASYYRWADGSEGSSVTVTLSANANGVAYRTERITGADSGVNPQCETAVGATSTAPNPPSLTPSWGAADTLWTEEIGWRNGSSDLTAYSTNYSSNQIKERITSGTNAGVASATRDLNATSDDPGTATLSASSIWVTNTVAIKPASGAMTVDVPVGLMEVTGVAPTSAKSAAVPVGLMKFTGVVPTSGAMTADVPVGLMKVTGVSYTPKRSVTPAIALVKLLGIKPTGKHDVAVPAGKTSFTGVIYVPKKTFNVPFGNVSFAGLSPSFVQQAAVNVGLADFSITELTTRHDVSTPVVAISLLGVAPSTAHAVSILPVVVEFVGMPIQGPQLVAVPAVVVEFAALSPSIPISASVQAGLIEFTGVTPVTKHHAEVPVVVISFSVPSWDPDFGLPIFVAIDGIIDIVALVSGIILVQATTEGIVSTPQLITGEITTDAVEDEVESCPLVLGIIETKPQ